MTTHNQSLIHCDKAPVLVAISELKPHPKNRNTHPKEQIERLAQILKYQGWRYPVKVSTRSGFITAGHGRIEAAKLNGWKEVPVSYQDYESEEQEIADLVADNAIASWSDLDLSGINADIVELGPDFDIDLLGIKDFVLEPADKLDPGCDEDEVPEHVEPKAKRGDIYQLGRHRLMCGDSTSIDDVERLMAGQRADMVFTDPPYGVAVENTQGAILGDEDLTVFKDVLPLLKAYSKESAHFYVWCAAGERLPESIYSFAGVIPFQNLLPVRCTHENKRGRKGAFKLNYEVCLFGNNNERTFNSSKKFPVSETTLDDRYKGDGFLKVFPALWDGERATEHNMNIVHPTQKKVEMIEFYVEISSNEEEGILDLFGGSGSTLIACEKTNRTCFMMEISEHYCSIIIERWCKYTGKEAYLLNEDGTQTGWSKIKGGME